MPGAGSATKRSVSCGEEVLATQSRMRRSGKLVVWVIGMAHLDDPLRYRHRSQSHEVQLNDTSQGEYLGESHLFARVVVVVDVEEGKHKPVCGRR